MTPVQEVELNALKEFSKIAMENDISFFLRGGSVMGAVKYQGFVPWDDDMDFIMLRSDFEKLCEVSSEFKEPYFFQTEETDPGSLRCHAQLRNSETTGILNSELSKKYPFNQGIFIDIFPETAFVVSFFSIKYSEKYNLKVPPFCGILSI